MSNYDERLHKLAVKYLQQVEDFANPTDQVIATIKESLEDGSLLGYATRRNLSIDELERHIELEIAAKNNPKPLPELLERFDELAAQILTSDARPCNGYGLSYLIDIENRINNFQSARSSGRHSENHIISHNPCNPIAKCLQLFLQDVGFESEYQGEDHSSEIKKLNVYQLIEEMNDLDREFKYCKPSHEHAADGTTTQPESTAPHHIQSSKTGQKRAIGGDE